MFSPRPLLFATILALVTFYFFASFIVETSSNLWDRLTTFTTPRTPDFSRYAPLRTLSKQEFPTNDPHRRVIVLGDIHGMYDPLQALLEKVSYDPSADVLIHVGDIIAKGDKSLQVLHWMATHNITGVRGNHDQKVIEWRSWLDWIEHYSSGAVWLADFHAAADAAEPDDPEGWAQKHLKASKSKWSKKIPDGWKIMSDHYRIARAMSNAEYEYLLSLPLALHAPAAHAFIAHAGVLPSDPRYRPSHPRQPLARIPALPHDIQPHNGHQTIAVLRLLQESAVLSSVPQNQDPWVTLNMRGVLSDHSVTRGKDGTPWAELWNRDIGMCAGFDGRRHPHRAQRDSSSNARELPCMPATVVYGHAASRGLDVKRWSVGLDSGCVKNERLSALVLDYKLLHTPFDFEDLERRKVVLDLEARKKEVIPFGDGSARIVDVTCK